MRARGYTERVVWPWRYSFTVSRALSHKKITPPEAFRLIRRGANKSLYNPESLLQWDKQNVKQGKVRGANNCAKSRPKGRI
jgi:hypothetical protein